METTTSEKNLIREIIERLVTDDSEWFAQHAIWVGDTGRFRILNYQPDVRSEFNRLVRGMVVDKPGDGWSGDHLDLVKSFPFIRFFNHGEDDADDVDFSNSEMLEKLDGTMVGVFFPTGNPTEPHWHTRRMVSLGPNDKELGTVGRECGGNLMPIIGKYVRALDSTMDDVPYTYIFEMLHPATMVRTRYRGDQFGLYLIGARHLSTHRELTEEQLDHVAGRIEARMAREDRSNKEWEQAVIHRICTSYSQLSFWFPRVISEEELNLPANRVKAAFPELFTSEDWPVIQLQCRLLILTPINSRTRTRPSHRQEVSAIMMMAKQRWT